MRATMEKTHDFGEKKTEKIKGNDLPVWQTPKFEQSREKAIELIDSGKYGLTDGDFWILMNTYANGAKMMYTGLIISHDGCLKINDHLPDELKYKPECISIDKDGHCGSLVYTYNCPEQGVYEVGEVSAANCKNNYPYAMALKRCLDRVILKNSKVAMYGIYSDAEADSFNQPEPETPAEDTSSKGFQRKEEKELGIVYNAENNYRVGVRSVARRLGLTQVSMIKKVLPREHQSILNTDHDEISNDDWYLLYKDLLKVERKRQAEQEDVVV